MNFKLEMDKLNFEPTCDYSNYYNIHDDAIIHHVYKNQEFKKLRKKPSSFKKWDEICTTYFLQTKQELKTAINNLIKFDSLEIHNFYSPEKINVREAIKCDLIPIEVFIEGDKRNCLVNLSNNTKPFATYFISTEYSGQYEVTINTRKLIEE